MEEDKRGGEQKETRTNCACKLLCISLAASTFCCCFSASLFSTVFSLARASFWRIVAK
jgi:hypothetical protein